jgi:hypothetical protein
MISISLTLHIKLIKSFLKSEDRPIADDHMILFGILRWLVLIHLAGMARVYFLSWTNGGNVSTNIFNDPDISQ